MLKLNHVAVAILVDWFDLIYCVLRHFQYFSYIMATSFTYPTIPVIIRFDYSVINYDLAFDNLFISETYKIICLWSYRLYIVPVASQIADSQFAESQIAESN
jgi:hypothetical protein